MSGIPQSSDSLTRAFSNPNERKNNGKDGVIAWFRMTVWKRNIIFCRRMNDEGSFGVLKNIGRPKWPKQYHNSEQQFHYLRFHQHSEEKLASAFPHSLLRRSYNYDLIVGPTFVWAAKSTCTSVSRWGSHEYVNHKQEQTVYSYSTTSFLFHQTTFFFKSIGEKSREFVVEYFQLP